MTKILLKTLAKEKHSELPFWFMRQAGRYLPEYKKVRAQFPNFLEFCYNPQAACEVTIQPIARFEMSAAIIFSDILVIPDGLGMKVWFEEKIGPQLIPIGDLKALEGFSLERMQEKLQPVYKAISLARAALPENKTLIGFCGSAWTLACYMCEGKGSRDFANVRMLAQRNPAFFKALIALLVEAISQHAMAQIEAGVDVIQLFDSWAGVLSEQEFDEWVIAPTQQIIINIKKTFPHIPIIGFPRLSGEKMLNYAKETKVDGVNFDGSVSLEFAKNTLTKYAVLQGNLDSILLAENKNAMLTQAQKIIEQFGGEYFIFNLSHGILPHTPIENVHALSELIKNKK